MSFLKKQTHKSAINLVLDESYNQRKWLKKHGKADRMIFSDEMKQKLKGYFNSLNHNGSNAITPEQLQDPLLMFGLCQNKQQVRELFNIIDFNGTGQLDYKQFLEVFRRVQFNHRNSHRRLRDDPKKPLKYQQFANTLLGMEGKLDNQISFRLGMSIYRRKNIMNAVLGKNKAQKQKGMNILQKFKEQMKDSPVYLTHRQRKLESLPRLRVNLSTSRVKTQ